MGTDPSPGIKSVVCGIFLSPPDESYLDYISHLQTCLARIPAGAHTWIGGDLNHGNINWYSDSVKPCANTAGLCKQLLTVASDNFLDRAHENHRGHRKCLDLFFSNNPSLVNRVEVIPGIYYHETVYVESSLRPTKAQPLLERSTYTKKQTLHPPKMSTDV